MAMKRGYTALQCKSTTTKLRAIRPDIRIASDCIVGFPGETEDDHARLMKLVRDVGFDASFSFIFCPRPGTPAAALEDTTPYEVKVARQQELQAEECNRIVNFKGQPRLMNQLVDVNITQAFAHSLRAEVLLTT